MPNGPSRIGITSNANDRAQPPIAVRRRPVQETKSQTSNSTQRGCDAIRDSRICMLQTLTADPHRPHPIDVPGRAELSVIHYQLIGKITKSEGEQGSLACLLAKAFGLGNLCGVR